ncbi:MAG: metallopeptidase family protein [Ktedonobacteraceae bacterium]|nr:metallopeptidase family protein [Ktedonobacteraceae bacterium]MBO0789704.1 metallopeptidase family protein [Ktedonobacteraceae bacterium]
MVAEEVRGEDGDGVLTSFELLVREALNALPDEFRERMDNLAVFVESEPDVETLERFSAEEGQILLGLYQGTPLTAQSYQGAQLPERITLYQRPIELYCHGDPVRIREQIQRTLLHEVAHHFGIDHEEMPIWIK